MKSTIRSVAAIALSAICAGAVFAVTPTAGERNIDALSSWFNPSPEKTMPVVVQSTKTAPEATMAQTATKNDRTTVRTTRKEIDSGMN